MTRPVNLESRAALLERVAAYVLEHGLFDLSLRPLALAVDSSPRMLLYHFGSKESMVTAVLRAIRERQLTLFDRLRRSEITTPTAICKAAWSYMSDPKVGPMLKLFFETYALALRDPDAFPGFFEGAVEDWLRFLSDPICTGGASRQRARSIATIILAAYRGFMLDYAATGDTERIGRAIDLWSDALNSIKFDEETAHAQQA